MKIGRARIAHAIDERLIDGMPLARVAKETAAYLLAEGRVGELDSLIRDLMQERADAGIVELTAASAFPLSENVLADIERTVKGIYPHAKRIIINKRLDPAIVAGVRLELANQQLDLSTQAKMNHFKQLITAKD